MKGKSQGWCLGAELQQRKGRAIMPFPHTAKRGVGGGGGGIGGSPALQPILPTLSLFLILSFSPSSLAFSGNAMITGRHVYF